MIKFALIVGLCMVVKNVTGIHQFKEAKHIRGRIGAF